MKSFLALIVVTILSASAMARSVSSPFVEALNTFTNASPYEVLESIFDGASPTKMNDFPTVDDFIKKQICMVSLKESVAQNTTRDSLTQTDRCFTLTTYLAVVDKGTAGASEVGPLFPGTSATPSTTETRYMLVSFLKTLDIKDIPTQIQKTVDTYKRYRTKLRVTPTSFVNQYNYNGRTVDAEFHSAKGLIITKITDSRAKATVSYNYLWIEGSKNPGGNP